MNSKQKIIQQKLAYEDWKRRRDKRDAEAASTPAVESASEEVEEQRRSNREKYPEIAEFVDAVRAHFPDAKVVSLTPYTPEEIETRRLAQANRGSNVPDEPDDQR